jgi:ferredoxin-fold anticodon binding domain-containing protein
VLANNFNVLYSNTMNESQKEELKNILSLSEDELNNKTTELKESILTQVGSLLSESNDTDLTNKLSNVEKEVKDMKPSKYNYYRLNELKNGLN